MAGNLILGSRSRVLRIQGGGGISFSPSSLPLTGWWRASYSGSPWSPSASAGSSGGNGNLSEATNPPAVGTAVNGFTPADFDGTNDKLTGTVTTATLFDVTAGSIGILYMCDSAPAAVGPGSDPAMFVDAASNGIGIAINSTGPEPFILDSVAVAYRPIQLTSAPGSVWVFVQVKWDGTNLKARINSDSWTSIAAANVSVGFPVALIGARYDSGAFFDGKILEVLASDTVISDTNFDNIKSYLNARYGLAL